MRARRQIGQQQLGSGSAYTNIKGGLFHRRIMMRRSMISLMASWHLLDGSVCQQRVGSGRPVTESNRPAPAYLHKSKSEALHRPVVR